MQLRQSKKLLDIFKKYKPNCIFNLAAETHVDRSIDGPKNFIDSNIYGVFSLLEACKKFLKIKKNFKLIHISTDEVYGDIPKGRSKETDKYKPSSPYAASKASSDHLVFSYIRTFNIPAIVTNCSNNYGPKQHPEKLIPKIIYNIFHNKVLPIYGKGLNIREWIYVEDHCDALLKIFQKGELGNFYNIGSNINLKNKDLVKKILKVAKLKVRIGKNVKIKFVKDRPGHDARYSLNNSKINKNINWKSKTSLNEGLKKTISWYLNNISFYSAINKKDILRRIGITK